MSPGKIFSAVLTALLLVGAVVIGGGTPLSPGKIADATSMAADNAKEAAVNTAKAERSTRALADIAEDVRSQLDSSKRLLEIQLGLEDSSRDGAERAELLEDDIAAIGRELLALQRAAEALSEASGDAGGQVKTLAGSATDLEQEIAALGERFDEVVKQSRELNRKARGFDQLRDTKP